MSMLLGVVSDTHGHAENARAAVRVLESCQINAAIHCGDIGSTKVVELFCAWPTHFVLGNVDADTRSLRAAIERVGGSCYGRFGSLEAEGKRIAFLHGDDERLLAETIAGGRYNLVCHGHTHVPGERTDGQTIVLNPGALYRARRHTIALVRLPELEIAHLVV
jgi:putative phosphoesterase